MTIPRRWRYVWPPTTARPGPCWRSFSARNTSRQSMPRRASLTSRLRFAAAFTSADVRLSGLVEPVRKEGGQVAVGELGRVGRELLHRRVAATMAGGPAAHDREEDGVAEFLAQYLQRSRATLIDRVVEDVSIRARIGRWRIPDVAVG